jgi:hypothetical protein
MPDLYSRKIQGVESTPQPAPRRARPEAKAASNLLRPEADPPGPSRSEDRDSSSRPVKASRDSTLSTFPPRLPEGCLGFRIEGLETRGPFCSERSARSPRRVIEHRRTEFRAQEVPQHAALQLGTVTKSHRIRRRNRAPNPLEETRSTLRSIYRDPKNAVERAQGVA